MGPHGVLFLWYLATHWESKYAKQKPLMSDFLGPPALSLPLHPPPPTFSRIHLGLHKILTVHNLHVCPYISWSDTGCLSHRLVKTAKRGRGLCCTIGCLGFTLQKRGILDSQLFRLIAVSRCTCLPGVVFTRHTQHCQGCSSYTRLFRGSNFDATNFIFYIFMA